MIEGENTRVPAPEYWDIYRKAESEHSELVAALAAEIRNYAAGLPEVNTTTAGATVLSKWQRHEEWSRTFGNISSKLFGMVAWVALFDDTLSWQSNVETVEGRKVRIYRRPS
jgi:hypothetical protein